MQQPIHTIAPPADFEPLRIGEHPALDFLNSILAPSGETIDFLHNGTTFARWLSRSGVVPDRVGAAAKAFTPQQLDRLAAEARELREWFRKVVLRWQASDDGAVRPTDLDRLNVLLSKSSLTQAIERGRAGLELRARRALDVPHAVIAELAATCADLLVDQPHEDVHKCANPPCTLLFADTKRGPRRRWCSMAVCGNRTKVAAHRARQQRQTSGAADNAATPLPKDPTKIRSA